MFFKLIKQVENYILCLISLALHNINGKIRCLTILLSNGIE